jgi:hypothetical protein
MGAEREPISSRVGSWFMRWTASSRKLPPPIVPAAYCASTRQAPALIEFRRGYLHVRVNLSLADRFVEFYAEQIDAAVRRE